MLRALDQEENAEARAFYLTGWNGDCSYTLDRIARGMNPHVEAICLSMLGSTLFEGFRIAPIPMIEVIRPSIGRPMLLTNCPSVMIGLVNVAVLFQRKYFALA